MTPLVVIVGCQHPVGCVLPPDQPLSAMYGPHSPPGIQQFFPGQGKGKSAAPAPYPAQKQHEPLVRPPAAPRPETRRCALAETEGEKKTDSPTNLKWQIGLGQWHKPFLGGAAHRVAGGMIMPPSGGPGAQPRHAFGSFRRETKGTPGVGRVGPPMGRSEEPSLTTCSWRGAAPPRIGGRRGSQPRTTSRGAGRSACIGGCRDYVLA